MLKGLVFVSATSAVQPQGVTTEGLDVTGVPLLQTAGFHTLVAPYLGHPASLGVLHQLTRDVVLYCRGHDRPVVDVLVPEQNVQTGSVQILVLEGRLGQVRVEGEKWFSPVVIAGAIRLQSGDIIASQSLLEDLAWINRNPFRQVDLVFTRSPNPGATDLVLRTNDRVPLRLSTGYDDTGNALTGFDRVLVGVYWGNAFGLDQELGYQLSASPDFRKLVAHSGSYTVPLTAWRHVFTVSGNYAESRPDLSGGFFTLKGRAWQVSARDRIPLPAWGAFTQELSAGVDFKRSNNNLAFGGMQVFAQENDIVQAVATYTASRSDRFGATGGSFTLTLSPGGLGAGNHTRVFRAARSYARADYAYVRGEVERTTTLPAGFSWLVRATGQFATANLLSSEQLGLGGAESLRGYEDHEANGDDGFILVNELHARAGSVASHLGFATANDQLDPLLFWDYGMARSKELLPGEAPHIEMSSVGVGLRYNISACFNLRADYGWQLKDSGVSDGRRTSRGHISATLAY
jgi:hemolysin activation/secretion protein